MGIWYVRPDGNMAGIVRSDFRIEVELRDNDLWGMATPSSRVDLEVRTSTGTLKGTTTVWTDQEGNYGTDFRDAIGQRVDIQAGDVVKGTCGAKLTTLTIPNPFDAAYDYNTDKVCGHAPAGAQPRVDLWGYGTQTPTADGTNHYCATFGGDPGIETEGESRLDLVQRPQRALPRPHPDPRALAQQVVGRPAAIGRVPPLHAPGGQRRAGRHDSVRRNACRHPARRHDLRERQPRPNPTRQTTRSSGTWPTLAPGTERDITLTVSVDSSWIPATS